MMGRTFQIGVGWCVLLGALGVVVVTLIHPQTVTDSAQQMAIVAAQANQWDIAHELLFVDLVVTVPAVFGLGWLLVQKGCQWLGSIGAGLSIVGIAGGIGAAVDELIVGQMARMNGPEMLKLFDRIHGTGGFFVFPLAALQPVGLLLFSWGLFKVKVLPGWLAIVLAVGAVSELAGLPTASYWLALLGHGLELVGLGYIAWLMISGTIDLVWNTKNG